MRPKEHLRNWGEEPDAREIQRQRYRPDRVKLLFVGESPPASGRFFYHADSGLYRAFRTAFIRAIPVLENEEFLKQFQGLGCYLVDLCAKPVDGLDKRERTRACKESEVQLGRTIEQLQPHTVISVVRSIATNVDHALERANWGGRHVNLPYPGRWRHLQVEFEEAILPILRTELHVPDNSL